MILNEVESRLVHLGISGIGGEWPVSKGFIPDKPDQVIVVFETPGRPPDARVDLDRPSFQIRVRGSEFGYIDAREKAQEIHLALHTFKGNLLGTRYVLITAAHSPWFLQHDRNNRPEFVQNFNCLKTR